MSLDFFAGSPLISSNLIDKDDVFVGNGVTATFTISNKAISRLADSVQFGNTVYYAFNGGFTVNTASSTFTLSSIPTVGTQGVAPGQTQAVVAAFDQNQVLGVTNPRVAEIPLYLGDPTNINNLKYYNLPAYPGLRISVVNLITGANAQTSWIQLTSAGAASGNALTYGATGAPLYLPPLDAFTTLASSLTPSSSSMTVVAASGNGTLFWPGQYVRINIGNSTQEILHITSINYSTGVMTLDGGGPVYSHSPGETIYACAWKLWLKCTIPENANSNTPANLYNIGLSRLGAVRARP